MAEYDVGPVGLTVSLPREIPVPESEDTAQERSEPPAEQAPLPSYEGSVIDETA